MKKNVLIFVTIFIAFNMNAQKMGNFSTGDAGDTLLEVYLNELTSSAEDNTERLLVDENFQTWAAVSSSTTETSITKTTNFSNETLVYKIKEIQVAPSEINTDRFNYDIVSAGYLMAAKTATSYIELSPLASVTKVEFIHGATGSNRGYQLWKKSSGDADWVSVSNAIANPANGSLVSATINEENVALKFTNLNAAQNAYLFDLKIYGYYSSTSPQVSLNTSVNIENAGTITRSIVSDTYDQGTTLTLTATAHFGYRFVKWTTANGDELSAETSYTLTLDNDTSIIAVFEVLETYNFQVNIEGSRWGVVKLTPEPVDGKYVAGTVVTASITANPVTSFSYWDDGTSATSRTIEVTGDIQITAFFDEIPFITGWDFAAQEPRTGRSGDYYSEASNTGTISLYKPDGSTVNWLANSGSFSPSYPCIRKWTAEADFDTEQRYYQASFSTENYTNIRIKSLMSGNYQVYTRQIMQYSTDGSRFTDLTSVDISGVYNSGWAACDAVLPAEAEGQSRIYIRWIADTNSAKNGSGNDGTALTNIFIFADKVTPPDNDPPVLLSTSPQEGSATASANGSIVLTFNERVQAGTGNITLNGETLTGVYGSKTATFKYSGLDYNAGCIFVVPSGALKDLSGNEFAGFTLHFSTMNRPQPIAKLFDFVVAKDGTGNGTSIQSAFDAAPSDGRQFLIFVKNGRYEERPSLTAAKRNVSLIGQSREGVIISAGVYSGLNGATTSTCQTLEILADNFYMENITVENTAGVNAGQAVALKDYGKHNAYKNVRLLGYQDTHLTGDNSIHYYQQCDIRGTVDFIFGGGDIFFDNCLIYCNGRSGGDVITAPSTSASTQWGYVFRDCTIDGDKATQDGKYCLGRPWKNAPRAVFINTTMKILPTAAGWTNMGVIPALFAEYNSMNERGDAVDLSNRKNEFTTSDDQTVGGLQTVLSDAEAAQYTLENVVGVTDWNPISLTETTAAPVITASATDIVWENTNYAISYVIVKNDEVIAFTTDTKYTPVNAVQRDVLKVYAVAESGALSLASNEITWSATGINLPALPEIRFSVKNGILYLNKLPQNSKIEIYALTGQLIDVYDAPESTTIPLKENVSIVRVMTRFGEEIRKIIRN
jgi:pectin methylesterase-like acyl-CoA thioesterase